MNIVIREPDNATESINDIIVINNSNVKNKEDVKFEFMNESLIISFIGLSHFIEVKKFYYTVERSQSLRALSGIAYELYKPFKIEKIQSTGFEINTTEFDPNCMSLGGIDI